MADSELRQVVEKVGAALTRAANEYRSALRTAQVGHVEKIADSVLHISGLPSARTEELLEVEPRGAALVLGVNPNYIEAVAINGVHDIHVGAPVQRTGQEVTVPVGEALLGRVIDPLGNPLDGASLTGSMNRIPVERPAPRLHERSPVRLPLFTGALAVDSMFPIGRGQRQLIVGEEGTGKTSLVVDTILRQRNTDVVGVYVSIGRRRSETWRVVETFRSGADRWIVVAAPEDSSPGLRYLAPYAGTSVAEYFSKRGEHALVVYDDLTSHAVAWRELSLLLGRPPGREAYPGDIFYLHSHLLERAAQLSDELGGGSLTALPIAVLEGGRLTAYIPTNLISITDGQIVLSRNLFAAGQKPAVDAGLSVSRVGAKAQPLALRELAGGLRLDYAAFLELEAFSRLGTRLEDATQKRIERGRLLRALLRAPRLAPLGLFEEVARLVLGAHPHLLDLKERDIPEFSRELCERASRELPGIVSSIERDAVLGDSDRQSLDGLIARRLAERKQLLNQRPGPEGDRP